MIARLRRARWALLAGGIALAGAAALWHGRAPLVAAVQRHPYFAVTRVVIHGTDQALTPQDVRDWLDLGPTTTVWDATPGRVQARLAAHPYVAHARVRRQFPGALEIVVRERRPRAIVVLDDLFYVDRAGVTFGPLRADDARDLPVITGLDPAGDPAARRWTLRRALRLLRRCDGAQCLGPLSEVHVDPARGVTVFPTAPRVPVLLGWGSWSAKLERARRTVEAFAGPPERLARLDTRFRNQVVATLRPLPAAAVAPRAATPPARRPRGRGPEVRA